MAGDLTLNVREDARTTRLFTELPRRIREVGARRGLLKAAILLESHIKLNKLSGQVLHVRTGRLRASLAHRLVGRGDELQAVVGTRLVYARIHEYGGIIRAKRAPYLVFPITRLGATSWVRVKQVTMPKRSYLRPALVEKRREIIEAVAGELQKAIETP